MPTILPRDLTALLDALGVRVALAPPLPPRDQAGDDAARTGISAGWRPSFPGEQPPF